MPIYALGLAEPTIAGDAYVHPDAVIIGSVTIGGESSVWPGAVLRGDDGEILVGERTSVQDGCVFHTTLVLPTMVGDDCVIGHLAHLEGCTIGDRALVGSGAIILPGAVVGSGALVAAGALVLGGTEVPDGALALGAPATIRPDKADAKLIEFSSVSYVERAKRFASDLRRMD